MDYTEFCTRHAESGADVSLCVIPVSPEMASGLGILKMAADGRITEFCEKPDTEERIESLKVDVDAWSWAGATSERPLMASMGIYLFKTEVLTRILKEAPKMDFGRDIIPYSIPRYKVTGFVFTDYWEDIGTIRSFYQANLDLTEPNPRFNFYDQEAPIYSHPRFLPATRILDCCMENSIVSEGCIIRDSNIRNSVVGIRSQIREGTEISCTLLLGADYFEEEATLPIPLGIGRNSFIEGAIIDKNARIGSGVKITNSRGLKDYDGHNYYIREGIVIIPKNTIIEDGTTI